MHITVLTNQVMIGAVECIAPARIADNHAELLVEEKQNVILDA